MKYSLRCLAVAAALGPWSAGAAQTTPQDFLGEIREMLAVMGYSLEVGSEEMVGDTLVLTDVAYIFSTPQASGRFESERWEIRPIQEDGFDLALTTSPVFAMTMTFTDPALAGMGPMTMTYEVPGNLVRIGGTDKDRVFSYAAEGVTLQMTDFIPEMAEAGAESSMTVAAGPFSAEGRMTRGFFSGNDYTSTGTMSDMAFSYSISAPDGRMSMSASYQDLAMEGSGPLLDFADPSVMFASPAATLFGFSYGSSALAVDVDAEGEAFTVDIASGPGIFEGSFGAGRIDYSAEGNGTVLALSGASLPFPPVEARMDRLALGLAMPVAPSAGPSELGFELRMEGVSVSESLWSMFDPGALIPREPATVALRIASSAQALVNLMDPEAMAAGAPEMPFRIDDVRVEELLVSIGGAEVTATGEAVINNSGPVPMPSGGLDVALVGLVALSEKLVAAGLVPAEQAAALPAMLGAFAVQGASPDSFTSRIEMRPDGSVTANGVPLQ